MALTPDAGFPYYIELVGDADFKTLFSTPENMDRLSRVSEDRANYRYAPGKWSIKQIVGHLADHERIMIYRALRFSRRDQTRLAGYDQNAMTDNGPFNDLSYDEVLNDFKNIRRSSISFMRTLLPEQYELKGHAMDLELSVEEILKATIGHEIHHLGILRQRYDL